MKNQVIEVLDREHGKKVIEYWKSKGVSTDGFAGTVTKRTGGNCRFYGVIDGRFGNYDIHEVEFYKAEIITLPEDKPYPRVMWVWDADRRKARKRVVFAEKKGHYLAWEGAETFEDAENTVDFSMWLNACEVVDKCQLELTFE